MNTIEVSRPPDYGKHINGLPYRALQELVQLRKRSQLSTVVTDYSAV